MQYIRELAEYNGNGRAAVTFGKFDGLHRGHQMLVTKVRELGKQENINSIVCSFDMRPLWKEKGIAPELLMVGEERQERVKDEVDYLIECPFTESFRQKSAEDFIQEIIHDLFHAKYIVVGTDFTFGCEKRGDVHMLAEYADQYDYELIVIEKERYHDRIISSTYVKEVVKEGDVGLAETLLGYPFEVEGTVEHGRQLGRTLGFPTLNVAWPEGKIVPAHGVYFCKIRYRRKDLSGNCQCRYQTDRDRRKEAVDRGISFRIFWKCIRGKSTEINLKKFRRPEQKFDGIDAAEKTDR